MQNHSLTASNPSKTIDFPVQSGKNVAIGEIKYMPESPVIENDDMFQGVLYLIEANSRTDFSLTAIWSFRKACETNNVKCQELIDAFWKAYSDPYVGQEGIHWRHLWKHIEKTRGEDKPNYTYEEMLNKMSKDQIPMECFSMINKTDSRGRQKWTLK